MKIYKTNEEVIKDIKDGELVIKGDVTFECSVFINANITARNITAYNIDALNINACIINANDINANDIKASNINACDILYYAFCCVYRNIKCSSIKARRTPSKEPICLEGKLEIISKEDDATTQAIALLKSNGYKIVKE
jgi:hypothetical protein